MTARAVDANELMLESHEDGPSVSLPGVAPEDESAAEVRERREWGYDSFQNLTGGASMYTFRRDVTCAALFGALAIPFSACSTGQAPASANTAQQATAAAAQAPAARGEYLAVTAGCHDCHTPKKLGANGPEPDMSRMLSGHPENDKIAASFIPAKGSPWTIATNGDLTAWSGPWGVSFAANLTPDPNTGLRSGVWTEELFIKALRTGMHMGTARAILPPMPWQDFARFSDDDLKAIWAYLQTIPPVQNHVPDPIPPAGAVRSSQ